MSAGLHGSLGQGRTCAHDHFQGCCQEAHGEAAFNTWPPVQGLLPCCWHCAAHIRCWQTYELSCLGKL